jgi:hypothetical protein
LPKDCFINLLFLETIKDKGERWKEAKSKFNYWIQLGEPLVAMAQRYGVALLALLPKTLTNKK